MSEIKIFTDGSYIGSINHGLDVGAWVAIIITQADKIILNGTASGTSHNRMELLAVIEGIEFLIRNNNNVGTITIYSDSQYVVQLEERIERLKINHYLTSKGNLIQNKDLVQRIAYLVESATIQFVKVKAHKKKTGIANYNREADILARKLARAYLQEILCKKEV